MLVLSIKNSCILIKLLYLLKDNELDNDENEEDDDNEEDVEEVREEDREFSNSFADIIKVNFFSEINIKNIRIFGKFWRFKF